MPEKNTIIDVHHHIIFNEYIEALAKIGVTTSLGKSFPEWSMETMIDVMDKNSIETAITSVSSPGVNFGDKKFTTELATMCNKLSRELIEKNPRRIGAFASLPLPYIDNSLKEIEYALDVLKLDGVVLMTNIDGKYLGDSVYDEIFAELNQRKAVVYVHPTDPPYPNVLGDDVPNFLAEVTFDTTRAIMNLIFTGTLEKYPDISMIFAHAGGTTPFLAWRLGLGIFVWPGATENAPKGATEYMKKLYYDIGLSANPNAFSSLNELVPSSRILFGSDYPFAPEEVTALTVDGLNEYKDFSSHDLQNIRRNNGLKLFPRLNGA